MKQFDFTIEQKIITWEVLKVSIDAETEEEALERCKKEDYDDIYDSEICYDESRILEPLENECNSTFIIRDNHGKCLYENGL